VSYEDYINDITELKLNLSHMELSKIEHIIKRLEKITILENIYKKNDVYTDEELFKFIGMNSIKKSIKQVDNYWQLYNYKLPIKSFEPSIFCDKYKLNEIKSCNKIKGTNKVIFDVGGYCGDSALILKEFFPNNKLYVFECVKPLCDMIETTIKLNNLQDVIPVNLALGNVEDGEIDTKYAGFNSKAKLSTLDKYVKENNIEVGLIKTDIEGAEWDLLHGSIETIKKQKPILVISIYHNYRDFMKIKPFIESLDCGYRFSFCDSCYGLFPIHEITLNCEAE
jgi:FkbM family methyltransferase